MRAKKIVALLLAAVLAALCLAGCGTDAAASAAKKALKTYDLSAIGAGDEWLALCLNARDWGVGDGWREDYARSEKAALDEDGGVLSDTQYTQYSLAVLALTAAGYDASDFEGYDLTAPLADFDATVAQGLNGAVYALLALDAGGYDSDLRDGYVEYILARQLEDGGFAYNGSHADPDMTAMALTALAPYRDRADVAAAADEALARLSGLQLEDGGYSSWGTVNCESCAQVLLALCQWGIAADDARFVKNGKTVQDKLLSYQLPDGSFAHLEDGESDPLATRQALTALTAALRFRETGKGLFTLDDRPSCTLEIRCDTLLEKRDELDEAKRGLVPADGVILAETKVYFTQGETVLDVLKRALQARDIPFEFQDSQMYGVGYIEGIANLYEYDCGELSGWMYSVNGTFPGLGCGQYELSDKDTVRWVYTCDLGEDVGDTYVNAS